MRRPRIIAFLLLAPLVALLLWVGARYLAFEHYVEAGIHEQHRRDAIGQLCGLLADDAKPLVAYTLPNDATGHGHVYWAAFPLQDTVARSIASGGIDAATSAECREGSDWLRRGRGWKTGAQAVADGRSQGVAYQPTELAGLGGGSHPQIRWLASPGAGELEGWTALLADGSGWYLESGGGKWTGIPRVVVHPAGKVLFLTLTYIHDLAFW
jgi:hypothetical protein